MDSEMLLSMVGWLLDVSGAPEGAEITGNNFLWVLTKPSGNSTFYNRNIYDKSIDSNCMAGE